MAASTLIPASTLTVDMARDMSENLYSLLKQRLFDSPDECAREMCEYLTFAMNQLGYNYAVNVYDKFVSILKSNISNDVICQRMVDLYQPYSTGNLTTFGTLVVSIDAPVQLPTTHQVALRAPNQQNAQGSVKVLSFDRLPASQKSALRAIRGKTETLMSQSERVKDDLSLIGEFDVVETLKNGKVCWWSNGVLHMLD